MLIKIFTCGNDAYDSLYPICDSDFSVNLYRLPRGYHLEVDEGGSPYILCPNRERVYELDRTRAGAASVRFSYPVNGKRRTVRLQIDREATRKMLFSGEPYRQFP